MWNERRLPRLNAEFYQGEAWVLWTHVSKNREAIDWNTESYQQFRELLLHCCGRYKIGCARYVCMPDHIHLIWIGAHSTSDQLKATRFLRSHSSIEWQKQAHDHVLRDFERDRGAFVEGAQYLRDNPVRAGLIKRAEDWPYAGSIVPGYPNLDPWNTEHFWKCFNAYKVST